MKIWIKTQEGVLFNLEQFAIQTTDDGWIKICCYPTPVFIGPFASKLEAQKIFARIERATIFYTKSIIIDFSALKDNFIIRQWGDTAFYDSEGNSLDREEFQKINSQILS